MNTIHVKDTLHKRDNTIIGGKGHGIWAKTEVLCSNGDVIYNPYGKSSFAPGAPFTRSENMVVVGGVEYVMEKVFGVQSEQFPIPTMYSAEGEDGIGLPDSSAPTETYLTPQGEVATLYRYGNLVQLFGVGITGTAENDVSVYPVDYREKSIKLSKVNTDGLTVTGTMLPFRFTAETLSNEERQKYFGKKVNEDGVTAYYYKKFESAPVIKHIWKTGEDVDDETLVSSDDIWRNMSGLNAVETFTEIVFKVTKKDMKEWFISLEQEDRTRINTLALFSGEYVRDLSDPADYGDYRDVRLFSKLCIPTEYLTLSKDLNIIYRVYGQ